MTDIRDLISLKDYSNLKNMDYMYIYNRIKKMDLNIVKINPRLYLYHKAELDKIMDEI